MTGPDHFWAKTFPRVEKPAMRVLSHGGGVQTSTLLFMASRGDLPPFDAVIMGDTGNERQVVYDYLQYASDQTGTPIILAKNGDLTEHIRRSKAAPDGKQIVTLPYYLADGGQMQRTCTAALKIDAVTKECRRLLGLAKGKHVPAGVQVEISIGISTDEYWRSGGFPAKKWQTIVYPLLERDLSFAGCVSYLSERQIKIPPRSRCIVCPYRSNESWRELDELEFEHACQIDDFLRDGSNPRGFESAPYLHRDRVPLREVDLRRAADLFEEDCTGACNT